MGDDESAIQLVEAEDNEQTLRSWENLRREARKLENDLNSALHTYARLWGSLKTATLPATGDVALVQKRTDLAQEERELAERLEDMTSHLSRLIKQMDECVRISQESDSNAQSKKKSHTVDRYRGILQQDSEEYEKTKNKIKRLQQRHTLLHGHSSRASVEPKTEMLLREQSSVRNSVRNTEIMISEIEETKESLERQREMFESIGGKLGFLMERFPAVNKLIKDISASKHRDNIVLAFVIASCMFFTFFYVMAKR